VFAPHGPHLFIGRKFATGGGSFRGRDGGALLRRKPHGRRRIIRPGKPENNAGDIVLSVRRKTARCFERLVEAFCHRSIIAGRG